MAALIPSVPSIPRPPLGLPDPLRRVHVKGDLEKITARGEEAPAADGGATPDQVEAIWETVLDWYRAGVHPALQVCVRRNGAVILDRAVGYSHGNAPGDGRADERTLCSTETPFCIFSTSKAITAFVVHKLIERGTLSLDDPVADYIDGYEAHGKHEITVGHVLAHRAGVPNLPPEALDLEFIEDREFLAGIPGRRQAVRTRRQVPRLPRRLGRVHLGRGRPCGHRQGHPHRVGGGVPRPARVPLEQLRGRRRRPRRRRGQLRHPAADGAAALQPAVPRAPGIRSTTRGDDGTTRASSRGSSRPPTSAPTRASSRSSSR